MASTISVLLCSTLGAAALQMPAAMLDGSTVMSVLYTRSPAAFVDYVAAMRNNAAQAAGGEQPPNPFRRKGEQARQPWTWTAADGDMIRRLEVGVFVIRHGDYFANWFTDLECTILEWPAFQCADGRTLTMSAPGPDIVVFGDVEYRR